jgi:hypothetical protein
VTYGYEHAQVVKKFLDSNTAALSSKQIPVTKAPPKPVAAKTDLTVKTTAESSLAEKPVPFFLKEKTDSTSKEKVMARR